jgi:hypothetical protein
MEILKFDDEKSPAPRKRSGRGAILVAFIAVALGAGTALASGTLSINGTSNTIALDQGVAATVQCDTDGVDISLSSSINSTAEKFYVTGINVSKIADTCIGKSFRVRIYDSTGIANTFCDDQNDADCFNTYVEKTVTNDTSADLNSLSFSFSQVLWIQNAATAAHVTIESIG